MKDTPSSITPYRTVFNKPTSLPFPAIVPCISRYLLRTSMYFLLPWRRLSKNQKSSSKFVIERTKKVNCKLASVKRAIFSSENNILILSSPPFQLIIELCTSEIPWSVTKRKLVNFRLWITNLRLGMKLFWHKEAQSAWQCSNWLFD